MKISISLTMVIVSAFLLTAAFPPFDLGILAWFGLAPFLFALRQKGLPAAAGLGFMFGVFFGTGAFCWAKSVEAISLPSFLIWLCALSLYFAFFGFFYRLVCKSMGSWILIGAPCLWVVMEYMRSNLFFLAWPWNLLGHSQHDFLSIIQIADITGVYGISFVIIMFNQVLSQVPAYFTGQDMASPVYHQANANIMSQTAYVLVPMAVLGLMFTYGRYSLGTTESQKHIRVALVQANALTRDKMPLIDQANHMKIYTHLTMEAAKKKPDLIIWPDSSLPAPISSSRLVRHTTGKIVHKTGTYLLAGGAGQEKLKPRKGGHQPYSNSNFLISPSGSVQGQYNKMRLLPFNEYLPFQNWISWPGWITTLKKSYLPGEEYTVFEVAGARFGAPICWENLFSAFFRCFVAKGANFMVSTTNEGFWGVSPFSQQALAMNIFRAVENRVAIARVSPTGISCFINPDGKIVERVQDNKGKDTFVSGFLVRDVPLSDKKSFYTVYGDIFAFIAMGVAVLSILFTLLIKKPTLSQWRI